jgi:hypothetical protein
MNSIPTFRPWYRRALDALIDRALALPPDATDLRDLDARTLADIGIDASEIDSIDAESRGSRRAATRRRIAFA